MEITAKKNIKTFRATGVTGLDDITLYIDNIEESKGKILIECHGKAWSAYWGGMSGRTVEEFFLLCSNAYIIGMLSSGASSVEVDYVATKRELKKELFSKYRREVSSEDVNHLYREDFDRIEEYHIETLNDIDRLLSGLNNDDIYELHYEYLPKCHTTEYLYLDKIVSAVKEILKGVVQDEK